MPFPKQAERKLCWESKDAYWDCLTKNDDDKSKCTKERQKYENSCIKQWVIYFDRRRDYLKYKTQLENAGFEPSPESKAT